MLIAFIIYYLFGISLSLYCWITEYNQADPLTKLRMRLSPSKLMLMGLIWPVYIAMVIFIK